MTRFLALMSLSLAVPAYAEDVATGADPHWLAKLLVGNLLPMIITVLTPLLMAALAYLTSYLRAKSAESKAAKVGLVVAEAANSVVAELNVTLKPKLQSALADGKLTPEEKAELKNAALEALKTKLPASLMDSAKGLFGGFVDTWLAGLIERSVTAQKQPAKPKEEAEAAAAALAETAPAVP